jgi:hypothetical protein
MQCVSVRVCNRRLPKTQQVSTQVHTYVLTVKSNSTVTASLSAVR